MKRIFASITIVFLLLNINIYAFEESKAYIKVSNSTGVVTRMNSVEVERYEKFIKDSTGNTEMPFSGYTIYPPYLYVSKDELYEQLLVKAPKYNENFDVNTIRALDNNVSPLTWQEASEAVVNAFGDMPEPKGDNLRNIPAKGEYYISSADITIDANAAFLMSHGALPVNYMMLKYPSIEDMENFLALVYKLYGGEPEDDFYTFVNKKSLDESTLLSDRLLKGENLTNEELNSVDTYAQTTIYDIAKDSEKDAAKMLDKILYGDREALDSREVKIRDFYESILNTQARNNMGVAPIKYYLDAIDNAKDTKELADMTTKYAAREGSPYVRFYVVTDPYNTDKTVLSISPLLPNNFNKFYENKEEDYYRYREFVIKLFMLGGEGAGQAEDDAEIVLAFEKELARAYNGQDLSARIDSVQKYFKNLDLSKIAMQQGYDPTGNLYISNFEVFKVLGSYFDGEHTKQLKTMAKFCQLYNSAPYLSEDFSQLLRQYSDVLRLNSDLIGDEAQTPEERALKITMLYMEDYIGQLYCDEYFTPEDKQNITNIFEEIKATLVKRISETKDLDETAKTTLINKVNSIKVVLGYPDDLTAVLENADIQNNEQKGYYNNILEIMISEMKINSSKQGKPAEALFYEKVYSAEARYMSLLNTVLVPAGVLRKPIYSSTQSKSQNYGGVGFVLAHELSHAVDFQNILTNGSGNNFSVSDETRALLEEKYESISNAYEGEFIENNIFAQGNTTVNENFADILAMELIIDIMSQHESKGENVSYSEMFENFARMFYQAGSREFVSAMARSDTHSYGRVRVNACLSNFDKFYEVYGLSEKDAMYRKKEKRVNIW
ncbi:MAG: M13 family metallopeptidase [Firmicutes bacterium]|nr:M13 family metallopeptidase [Bacillota bacterium]